MTTATENTITVEITNEYERAFVLGTLWSDIRTTAEDMSTGPANDLWGIVTGEADETPYWRALDQLNGLRAAIEHASQPETRTVTIRGSRDQLLLELRAEVNYLAGEDNARLGELSDADRIAMLAAQACLAFVAKIQAGGDA